MTNTEENKTSTKDFRGLTIFEILIIIAIVGGTILWALSSRTKMQNKVYDEMRKGRISTLKENLMVKEAENSSFPSDEQFKNDDTRKKIFSTYLDEYGSDSLHDPKNTKTLIDYFAEPEGCAPDTDKPCTKVSVSLTLSNGEDFFRFGIQPGKELEYYNEAAKDLNVPTNGVETQ